MIAQARQWTYQYRNSTHTYTHARQQQQTSVRYTRPREKKRIAHIHIHERSCPKGETVKRINKMRRRRRRGDSSNKRVIDNVDNGRAKKKSRQSFAHIHTPRETGTHVLTLKLNAFSARLFRLMLFVHVLTRNQLVFMRKLEDHESLTVLLNFRMIKSIRFTKKIHKISDFFNSKIFFLQNTDTKHVVLLTLKHRQMILNGNFLTVRLF